MDVGRTAVSLTVALLALTTLASGPLVGAVDLTRERSDSFAPGTGSLDATVLDVPDRVELVKGRYGAGAYYLRVPDARVRVDAVEGQPMLVYKLRVPELGYARGTTHFLEAGATGVRSVGLEEGTLAPDRVGNETYAGELRLVVRDGDGERILDRRAVTVAVRR